MRLHIRLFARARELAGTDMLTLEVPAGIIVAELRQRLVAACPALAGLLPRCAVAVNDELADEDRTVPPEADVALLPPVSGGS
jgi:molybdopterin converting factor subunit 1